MVPSPVLLIPRVRPHGSGMVLGWMETGHEKMNLLRRRIFWGSRTVLMASHKQQVRRREQGTGLALAVYNPSCTHDIL